MLQAHAETVRGGTADPILRTSFSNGQLANVVGVDLTQLPYALGNDATTVRAAVAKGLSYLVSRIQRVVETKEDRTPGPTHLVFVTDGPHVCPGKEPTQAKRATFSEKDQEAYLGAKSAFGEVGDMTLDTHLPPRWDLLLKKEKGFRKKLVGFIAEAVEKSLPLTEDMVLSFVSPVGNFRVSMEKVEAPRDPMSADSTIQMTAHTYRRRVEVTPSTLHFPKLAEADQYLLIAIKRVLDTYPRGDSVFHNVVLVTTDGDMIFNVALQMEFGVLEPHGAAMQILQTMVPSRKGTGVGAAAGAGAGAGAGASSGDFFAEEPTYVDLTSAWRAMRRVFPKWDTHSSVATYVFLLLCGSCDYVENIKGITCKTLLDTAVAMHTLQDKTDRPLVEMVPHPHCPIGSAFKSQLHMDRLDGLFSRQVTEAAGWTTRQCNAFNKGAQYLETMFRNASLVLELATNNTLDREGNHFGFPDCFEVDDRGLPIYGFLRSEAGRVERFLYNRPEIRSMTTIGVGMCASKPKAKPTMKTKRDETEEGKEDEDEDEDEPRIQVRRKVEEA